MKANNLVINVYFGVPGAGKSTVAAALIRKYRRKYKGIKCYSNFAVSGAYLIDSKDIGQYEIDGFLFLDEAGVDFNNRQYKSLPLSAIDFFKKARKHGVPEINIFSQRCDDFDITLRNMATNYYLITRRGFFIRVRHAIARQGIDKETGQWVYKYRWACEFPKIIFGPLYWRFFNSYDVVRLPVKYFPLIP